MKLELKKFVITQQPPENNYPEGMIWIQNEIGEGMGVQQAEFEALIAKYFEENF